MAHKFTRHRGKLANTLYWKGFTKIVEKVHLSTYYTTHADVHFDFHCTHLPNGLESLGWDGTMCIMKEIWEVMGKGYPTVPSIFFTRCILVLACTYPSFLRCLTVNRGKGGLHTMPNCPYAQHPKLYPRLTTIAPCALCACM